VGNDIAANYGDQLRIEGNKLGTGDLHFENNRVDWSFQPSFKHPDLAPIVRQQGNKAFLEAPEVPTSECRCVRLEFRLSESLAAVSKSMTLKHTSSLAKDFEMFSHKKLSQTLPIRKI